MSSIKMSTEEEEKERKLHHIEVKKSPEFDEAYEKSVKLFGESIYGKILKTCGVEHTNELMKCPDKNKACYAILTINHTQCILTTFMQSLDKLDKK